MPTCKNCGTLLDKGEKICPICQTPNPLGNQDEHVDFTDTFKPVDPEYKLVKQKSRILAAVFGFFLGFSGAPFFYLGFKKTGIVWAVLNVAVVACMIIFRATPLALWIGGTLLVLWHLGLGINYLIPHDQKDARGEYLK